MSADRRDLLTEEDHQLNRELRDANRANRAVGHLVALHEQLMFWRTTEHKPSAGRDRTAAAVRWAIELIEATVHPAIGAQARDFAARIATRKRDRRIAAQTSSVRIPDINPDPTPTQEAL